MDWDYFVEEGKFKAKRLPKPQCGVKIKDASDLADLRSALRGSTSIESAKEEYSFHCDFYDIEVEEFEAFLERNASRLLKKLPMDYDLFSELLNSYEELHPGVPEWTAVDEKTALGLEEADLVELIAPEVSREWWEHYSQTLTVSELGELSKSSNLGLKGNKSEKLEGLWNAIESEKISPPQVFLVRPSGGFGAWYEGVQSSYVEEVEEGLKSFDYPDSFKKEVWAEVLINDLTKAIKEQIRNTHSDLLAEKSSTSSPVTKVANVDTPAKKPGKASPAKYVVAVLILVLLIWLSS